jgi:hypothetical protein
MLSETASQSAARILLTVQFFFLMERERIFESSESGDARRDLWPCRFRYLSLPVSNPSVPCMSKIAFIFGNGLS